MSPEQLAKSDTEAGHQTALFCWAALNQEKHPELRWLHHIPNGGSRGSDAKSRAISGARMKAQGVKTGIPDVFLPVRRGNWCGLYVELKKPGERPKRGGKGGLSDDQVEFAEFAIEQGYGWSVCYTWEEAAQLIEEYLNSD